MKNLINSYLVNNTPDLYHAINSYKFSRYCRRRHGKFQDDFARHVYKSDEITVLTGPFRGMQYFNKIVWGPITPKWIGSYEMELHPIIEKIIATDYKLIVDIGAAEGYYAVGLARACPSSQLISFDVDPIARKRQARLASLNYINNLHIRKYCSHADLSMILNNRSLLLCDIEGFEYELVDPLRVSQLRETDILVEIHPHESYSAVEVKRFIIQKFSKSHDVSVISLEHRNTEDWRSQATRLQDIDENTLKEALNEYRNDAAQEWLWMRSEHGAGLNITTTQQV